MKWLFVLLALFSLTATAQQTPALGLSIEFNEQDSDIKSCGLTKASIESLSTQTLRHNQVQTPPSSDKPSPFLYVNPTVLYNAGLGLCAVSLELSIRWFTPQDNVAATSLTPFRNRNGLVDLVYCESSVLFVTPLAKVNERFNTELEKRINLCLGKLNY